ncbi:DUF397 domain-containing protein [Streptomyces globosus]|uniref:DUF397 domain-containing protein n=2 Tax=Streptomyces globosus TaxID=68209 RepID=A0A344TU32_9ACTN|nr:DUF397 domain-containing protein [Streptomyces globosus]AXE22153.1 DUF397 domain-containing protein [Streptomyces globosus]
MNLGELGAVVWRKSSYSNGDGGNCIEVAVGAAGVVPVRDSKRPTGPVITVTAAAWAPFLDGIKGAP